MKLSPFILFAFIICVSCNNRENYKEDMKSKPQSELVFEKDKWKFKKGKDYPFREQMINDIVYNDTVRFLTKQEILDLFGEPSYYRDNKNFLYYTITQKRIFTWPLHTRSMVIKFSDENTIDWIKIHE